MKLPIELIPNTDPPKFKWSKEVDSLIGVVPVYFEGVLPSNVEDAVVELIELAQRQAKELVICNRRCSELEQQVSSLSQPNASRMSASQLAEAQKPNVSLKKKGG